MEAETLLEAIEVAKTSGKLKKGVNEVTKAIERGTAKLVVAAQDVSPKEIIMHLPLLAKEKGCLYGEVSTKEDLGAAAGLEKPTSAVAIVDAGKAKDIIASLTESAKESKAEAPAEKVAEEASEPEASEEAPAEEPAEEKTEESGETPAGKKAEESTEEEKSE